MMRILVLAVLAVLAGCPNSAPPPTVTPTPQQPPPSEPPPSPTQAPPDAELTSSDACTTDADCTISNFNGCCACPGCEVGAPSARSKTELAGSQEQCKAVRCDMERCKTMLCKPGEPANAFTAVCRAGTCAGVRK